MLVELQPGLALREGTFNAVVAPEHVALSMINTNADLQRFLFLFIGGNFSRILSGVHRTATNFDVQRAFTAHQLFTILTEASHSFIFIEHDPTLYDGAREMIAPVAGALLEVSHDAIVVLYSPTPDRAFQALIRDANRVYILSVPEGSRRQYAQVHMPRRTNLFFPGREQRTLDSWCSVQGRA